MGVGSLSMWKKGSTGKIEAAEARFCLEQAALGAALCSYAPTAA